MLPSSLRDILAPTVNLPLRMLTNIGAPSAYPIRSSRTAQSVLVVGTFSVRSGIGNAARLLVKELRASGIRTETHDVSDELRQPPDPALAPREVVSRNSNHDAVVFHLNPPQLMAVLPYLPDSVSNAARRIGYWAWELDRMPAEWLRPSKFLHEIWSPSQFVAQTLRASIHDRPVFVVPHPAALTFEASPTLDRAAVRARLGIDKSTFVAVQSFSFISGITRKNPFGTIEAFDQAFRGTGDAMLVLRCRDTEAFPEEARALYHTVSRSRSRIYVATDALSIRDLYAAGDAYVSLHRSEGFGLNLAEAMLSELAVVATGWSGNMDFMDSDCCLLAPYVLTSVADPQGAYVDNYARWAEPDVAAAARHLRLLYDQPLLREHLAQSGYANVMRLLSGGRAATVLRRQQ